MFRFDTDSFKTWFMMTAKYPKKDIDLYTSEAKQVMIMCAREGLTPQYKLPPGATKSGLGKYYVQLANRKREEVIDTYKQGYEHFIHSVDGFAYFKTSLAAAIYGMWLVKEYESFGWKDEIETINQGKITGNVISLSGGACAQNVR